MRASAHARKIADAVDNLKEVTCRVVDPLGRVGIAHHYRVSTIEIIDLLSAEAQGGSEALCNIANRFELRGIPPDNGKTEVLFENRTVRRHQITEDNDGYMITSCNVDDVINIAIIKSGFVVKFHHD